MKRAERLRRALGPLGFVLVFLVASFGGLVLHLDTPVGRRAVARVLERLLTSTFRGRFEISALERLTLGRVVATEVRVFDPQGRLVLTVEGLRARADITAIVFDVLFGEGKLTIDIAHARAERVRVVLIPDPKDGVPTIARAFELAGPPVPSASSRQVRVWLPAIEIGRGHARGGVVGLPAWDADVFGARGSVLVAPVGVAVDAPHFSAVVRGLLPSELRAVGSFHQRGTTRFWTNLDGYVGDLQVNSVARLEGKRLQATFDVPRADPAAVRALVPDWPLREVASLHAELVGDLPRLTIVANGKLAEAELDAKGTALVGSQTRLELEVSGKRLDLRALLAESPQTSVDARTALRVSTTERGALVEFDGTTEPTTVLGLPVPGTRFRGRYADRKLDGSATLHEPGMPLSGTVVMNPDGVIDLTVDVPRFRLEQAPRLQSLGARGALSLNARGRIEGPELKLNVSADFEAFTRDWLGLRRAHVEGSAQGPFRDPRGLSLDASLRGEGVELGAFRAEAVEARAQGKLASLALSASVRGADGLELKGKTRLAALGGTRLDDVDLTLSRNALSLHATAARVEFAKDSVEVSAARLDGSGGTLTASGRYRPGLVELNAHGENVDLDTIARALGVGQKQLAGKLDLNADLVVARDLRRGRVELSWKNGSVGSIGGVALDVSTSLEGESVTGETMARVEGYGSLRSSFELSAVGSLFEVKTWQRVTGRWDFGIERFELARVLPLLPPEWEVRELGGGAMGQLTVLRTSADEVPSVRWFAATDGLKLARGETAEEALRLSGVELQVGGNVDGTSGVLEASARVVDSHGLLLSGSARSELDLSRVLVAPREVLAGIEQRPLAVTLVVDGRPLDQLPEAVRPRGVSGALRAEASLRGTLEKPILAAKASLAGVRFGESEEVQPFDVCARGQYDPGENRVGLGFELYVPNPAYGACRGQRVAVGNAAGAVDLEMLARGERGFVGDANVALERFPLAHLAAFSRAGITGHVDGRISFSGTTERPQLSGKLSLRDGAVRDVPLGVGELSLRTDGRDGRAELEITRHDASFRGEARAGVNFRGLLPKIDGTRPAYLTATFSNLDAGVLEPVLSDTLADLAGRLDGTATAALTPRDPTREDSGFTGEIRGKMSMQNGTFQIVGLGMRLTQVKFDAEAKRVGNRTFVSIRGLSAASRSKHRNVAATADLYLDGVTLEGGRANANLSKVPLMIEGVSQATLTGSANLELKRQGDLMRVAIRLPELTASLPRSAGTDVVAVADHPDIEILQPVAEPKLVRGGDGLTWELLIDLGKKVRVVRGDMQIPVQGQALIALGERVKVSGDLELKAGGRVQLMGKSFVIETGEVHFDTVDPANPHLRVLASWHAPDSTVIWVEVRGTLREATLRLESDPVLPQNEIQALLLGSGLGDSDDGGTSGIGYGTDFVGELLGDTPLRRLELRMGAEKSVDDRSYSTYTAAVPLSDTLWLEGSYMNVNSSDVGEQDSAISTTIEWRFRQNWSLRTEVGTVGGGLDLLYQYRY